MQREVKKDIKITGTESIKNLSKNEKLRLEMLLKIRDRRILFAKEYHLNSHGEKMDFEGVPAICHLYNTLSPNVVIMGSMQSLKTEWCIIDHLASASLGLSVFYMLPKYELRNTFVANRIDKVIELVDNYKSLIDDGFFNNVSIKNFGKGVIKYAGSNVISDVREYPADMLVVDELDQCNTKIVREAKGRLGNSRYRFIRYIGNPEIEGTGIHKEFIKGTQKEWYAPCERCGHLNLMDWFKVVVEEIVGEDGEVVSYVPRDKEWNHRSRRDMYCICEKCGGAIARFDNQGEWREHNPGSKIESWHFSKLSCNKYIAIAEIWEEFQESIGDPLAMEDFYKRNLGVPFKYGDMMLNKSILDKVAILPHFIIKDNCAYVSEWDKEEKKGNLVTAGIDVGGTFFDIRISLVEGGIRKALYIGKVRSFDELLEICYKYNVDVAVIDSEPEVRKSIEFQEKAGFIVWRCKYHNVEGKDIKMNKNRKERKLTIDRTVALDKSFVDIKNGLNLLPSNYANILAGVYLKEMTCSVRKTITDGQGNKRNIWTKGVDHARHADTYDCLAKELYEVTLIDKVFVV